MFTIRYKENCGKNKKNKLKRALRRYESTYVIPNATQLIGKLFSRSQKLKK